jgi:hypothetical protein
MDEDHIGPGLAVGLRPVQRLIETEIGDQGFGARDHQQVALIARSTRRRDLALEFLDPDEVLPAAG